MDTFEQSLGYRSITPHLLPSHQSGKNRLSDGALLLLAQETLDANLAEALRGGVWHWKLDVREAVEEIAANLSFGNQESYEHLRAALLDHYREQYRRPSARAYLTYLRAERKEIEVSRYALEQQRSLLDLLMYERVKSWAEGLDASELVGLARSMHFNPFAIYLDVVDPYRVHHVTVHVVVGVVLGGHCAYRCPTPLWVRIALQQLEEKEGDGRITGGMFAAYLQQCKAWIALVQTR